MSDRRLWFRLLVPLLVVGLFSLTPGANADDEPPPRPSSGRHDGEHVLVGFRPGTTGEQRAAAHAGERGEVRNRFDHIDVDVVRVPEGQDPVTVAARYERNPNVEFAHPNWQVSILSEPDDTLFSDQWGLHNTGQAVSGSLGDEFFFDPVADVDVDGPEGWDAAFGTGSFSTTGGVRVGIVDTGIDLSHVDLLNKTKACASALTGIGVVTEGACQDDNLHGTHVAGTVTANTNNGVGVAGVAPNAELAVFKALNSAGFGWWADVIAGIHWAHTSGGAKIISLSLGSYDGDEDLQREVQEATKAGALIIAAAGNDGDDTANYPAAYAEVMSVASVSQDGQRSWFSNCNGDVEIAAPGEDIWSTFPGNSYGIISGTSMSTPHVSGVAAMVWWKNPGWSADQVRNQLKSTTEDSAGCGSVGVVNLAAALGAAAPEPAPSDPGAITGTVSEQRTKKPIANASVDCGAAGGATTASDGSYSITDVAAGSYTCTASATGYHSKSQSVSVSSGETTVADFVLRPRR